MNINFRKSGSPFQKNSFEVTYGAPSEDIMITSFSVPKKDLTITETVQTREEVNIEHQ